MKTPGTLIHEADYAFAFRTLDPRPDPPRSLLILLHGVGGDEEQLAAMGAAVAGDTLVVLPRGPRSISGGKQGWWRVGFSDDGPQIVEEEAEESRLKLIEFIGQLQSHFVVPPSHTVAAGFSQGGILAASAALTAPGCVAGFAVLCGRLLPEIEPRLGAADELAALDALIVHGRRDTRLPPEWAERATNRLQRLGVAHEVKLHDAGHELTDAMVQDFLQWFRRPDARWNHHDA